MLADCHIHMLLDGGYYRSAIARHETAPDEAFIRKTLADYQKRGYTYLRDGGDRWGAGARARDLAPAYGIRYDSPLFPIHRRGRYGGFIGCGFDTMAEYRELVARVKAGKGDFIKIMISGLMDFDHYGVLTSQPLSGGEIQEMIHIAHAEGFAVMAHANGAETVRLAAEAGVDSVEHGAYLDEEALRAMAEMGTIWTPTAATVGCLLGDDRYPAVEVRKILDALLENVTKFVRLGGILAPGSDAGAYRVFHGQGGLTERALLSRALGDKTEEILDHGTKIIMEKFKRPG